MGEDCWGGGETLGGFAVIVGGGDGVCEWWVMHGGIGG